MSEPRWECWFDGDTVMRDTSRMRALTSAAERFAREYGDLSDGESIDVRVKAIGSDDTTAAIVRVKARLELFTEVIEVPA